MITYFEFKGPEAQKIPKVDLEIAGVQLLEGLEPGQVTKNEILNGGRSSSSSELSQGGLLKSRTLP